MNCIEMERDLLEYKGKKEFGKKEFGKKEFGKKEFGKKEFGKKEFGKKEYGKDFGKKDFGKKDLGRDFRDKKSVDQPKEEIPDDLDKLEGRNSVIEALRAGRTINKIFIAKGEKEGSIKQLIALAREQKLVVQEVDRAKLDSLSSTRAHQGVVAFVAIKDYVEVDDILKAAEEKGEKPFVIILDEITDPHNLGSILRTANAVGAHGVIIPKRRAIGLTAAVSKASAGAIEYVPVARVTNIVQTIEYLKSKNIWVVGTDTSGDKAFFDNDLTGAVALVVGSEGEGMGKLITEKCDFVVNIPMKGEIASLNAAVAGAIVMYEILRQRSK
jgi:23S rRNA (guanosine2251-2'-O)-methyltransferase